jgi:hypothetical protein
MRSGHRGVYERKGPRRLPIGELFGPSLPGVTRKRGFLAPALAEALYRKHLEHEVDFLLASRQSPGDAAE